MPQPQEADPGVGRRQFCQHGGATIGAAIIDIENFEVESGRGETGCDLLMEGGEVLGLVEDRYDDGEIEFGHGSTATAGGPSIP